MSIQADARRDWSDTLDAIVTDTLNADTRASAAACQILRALRRIKDACDTFDNSLLVELLDAFALNWFAPSIERPGRNSTPYFRVTYLHGGAAGPLLCDMAEYQLARTRGLGPVSIPDGSGTRIRATAAELLAEVWTDTLNAAGIAGIDRVLHAALAALAPDPHSIPVGKGIDPEWFRLVLCVAINGKMKGLEEDIASAVTRLQNDATWKESLARTNYNRNYGRLTEPLAKALSPDLDAIEAHLKLEQVAAKSHAGAGGFAAPSTLSTIAATGNGHTKEGEAKDKHHEPDLKSMPERARLAYLQYQQAARALIEEGGRSEQDVTDDAAYEHLKVEKVGTLPPRDTWKRNLRTARNALCRQKKKPRVKYDGRSAARPEHFGGRYDD